MAKLEQNERLPRITFGGLLGLKNWRREWLEPTIPCGIPVFKFVAVRTNKLV